jgi:hypothetical protein
MDASLMTSLFEEMMNAIHTLYKAAPPTPFKHGPEFYAALRAADKAKAYLNHDMDDLITMEREDTRYWRERCQAPSPSFSMESEDHIGIPVLPAFGSGLGHPCDRNIIIGTPLSGPRSAYRSSPILNPEDEDEESPIQVAASATASVAEPPSNRERTVSMASSVTATLASPPVFASPLVPRPHINLFGITATPNMGPLLPSPLMTRDIIYDTI